MISLLFKLMFGHALGDFSQSDFTAVHKSRFAKFFTGETIWFHALFAHSMIHGGFVYLATGSVVLGMCEVVFHFIIDFLKNEKLYGFHMDQALHIACKVLIAYVATKMS